MCVCLLVQCPEATPTQFQCLRQTDRQTQGFRVAVKTGMRESSQASRQRLRQTSQRPLPFLPQHAATVNVTSHPCFLSLPLYVSLVLSLSFLSHYIYDSLSLSLMTPLFSLYFCHYLFIFAPFPRSLCHNVPFFPL